MHNYHFQIISIIDKLNELNEKINQALGTKLDSVVTGTILLGIILAITFWGISELNKK